MIETGLAYCQRRHMEGASKEMIYSELCARESLVERHRVMDDYEAWLAEFQQKAKEGVFVPGYEIIAHRPADVHFGARLIENLSGRRGHVWRARTNRDWPYRGWLIVKIYRRRLRESEPIQTSILGRELLRELQTLRGINHPNVVRVLDGWFSPNGDPWLALEYVPGIDLLQWKHKHGSNGVNLRLAVAVVGFFANVLHQITVQAAAGTDLEGTEEERRSKFIHGDIKPSNIVGCTEPLNLSGLKQADFGTALIESAVDHADRVKYRQYGTYGYMAPEQFGICERTSTIDVFALAVTLLVLLAPVDRRRFAALVGEKPEWHELHALWFPARDRNVLAPFSEIVRPFDPRVETQAQLPSFPEIERIFTRLDLAGLATKLIRGDDPDTAALRQIVAKSLAIRAEERIANPGELATHFATYLRDEELQMPDGRTISPRTNTAALSLSLTLWKQRDERLLCRTIRWRDPDDFRAVGGAAMILSVPILFMIAIWQAVQPLGENERVLTWTAMGSIVILLAARYVRIIVKSHLSVGVQLLRTCLTNWSIALFFIAIVFPVCRNYVSDGDESNDLASRADIAQLLATLCLFVGLACGREGVLPRSAVTAMVLSGTVLFAYCASPPGLFLDWWAEIAMPALYGVYLGIYFWETYVVPVLLNARTPRVYSLLFTPAGREQIFVQAAEQAQVKAK